MAEIVNNCVVKFEQYYGESAYLTLYLVSFVLLLVVDKNKTNKKVFIGQALIVSIIYWCPITAYIIANYCIELDTYWRMFWLLPSTIMMAYAFVKIIQRKEALSQRILMVITLCIVIMMSGTCIYNETNFQKANNLYKISQEAVAICDLIKEDAKSIGVEDYGVIVPNELIHEIKQYDGKIRMPYGRDILRGMGLDSFEGEIFYAMNSDGVGEIGLKNMAEHGNYQYLVYSTATDRMEFEKVGFRFVDNVGMYNIYSTKPLLTSTLKEK